MNGATWRDKMPKREITCPFEDSPFFNYRCDQHRTLDPMSHEGKAKQERDQRCHGCIIKAKRMIAEAEEDAKL